MSAIQLTSTDQSQQGLNRSQLRKQSKSLQREAYLKEKRKEQSQAKQAELERKRLAREGCLKIKSHKAYRAQIEELVRISKKSETKETLSVPLTSVKSLINQGTLAAWLIDSLVLMGIVVKVTTTKIVMLGSKVRELNKTFQLA